MKAKETRDSRVTSPFMTKVGASPISSPIMKVHASPFIMKAGASPIPNIETHVRKARLSFVYPL
jgi:hypothetical protein